MHNITKYKFTYTHQENKIIWVLEPSAEGEYYKVSDVEKVLQPPSEEDIMNDLDHFQDACIRAGIDVAQYARLRRELGFIPRKPK